MAYTITVGAETDSAASADLTCTVPSGTLTGQLLLIVTSSTTTGAAAPSTPSGWALMGSLATTDPLCVFGRIGTASESSVSFQWGSGQNVAYMVAISSPTGWPAIGSVLQTGGTNPTSSAPSNSADGCYTGHVVLATGNCIFRVGQKNGTLTNTPTGAAVTSGYTAGGFGNRGSAALVHGEMLTANSTIGSDPTALTTVAITGSPASSNRSSFAFEFVPVSTTTTISIDDATPSPGDAIVITKAEGAFVGTVQVELTDNNGAYVSVASAVTGSGATRTLTLPALATSSAVSAWDDADALWEKFAWGDVLTLRVTDDEGVDTDTLTITPPVADHFDKAAGGSYDHITDSAGTESGVDDVYVHVVSPGDGEGLPIVSGFQGNTVPTTVHFMKYDNSADKWLAATVVTFDVAAAALNGTFADAFGGAAADLDDHVPDTDDVGSGWVIERDLSTAAAPAADAVNIDGSGYLVITNANEGGTANIGVSDQDITVGFVINSDANDWSLHGRRVDDTAHITVFIRDNGTVSINQRVASVGIGVTGTSSVSLGAFADGTHIARLVLVGTSAKVYIDDVIQLDVVVAAANASGTKAGIYSSGTVNGAGVKFDYINVDSAYVAGTRTLTFSDSTVTPGQAITCTVVGADFAGTIDVGSINGISATPSGADLNSCTLTFPTMAEFDAGGTHITTPWYESVIVSISDGVGTAAVGTVQIEAPVPASFGYAGTGSYAYPPVGVEPGDPAYIHVVSGTGTANPETFSYTATTSAVIWSMAFSATLRVWLTKRVKALVFAGGSVRTLVRRSVRRSVRNRP